MTTTAMSHSADNWLTVGRGGPAATLTLHDSGRVDAPALVRALASLNADPLCRCIVLTGAGSDFCAGGEFFSKSDWVRDGIALRGRLQGAATLYRDLRRGAKPVVAAVEGRAHGAGLALVAACDYVVAAADASFRYDALGEGLLPEAGLLWSLPEKVGDAKARELMLLGEAMGAKQAQQAGLVNETSLPGAALEQALAFARRFEALPLVTVALTKAALFNGGLSVADAARLELDLNPLARQAGDHQEAVAAFLEKRRPNYVGN